MRVVGPLGIRGFNVDRGFNVEGHGVCIGLVESGLLRCELAPGAHPQSERSHVYAARKVPSSGNRAYSRNDLPLFNNNLPRPPATKTCSA